MVYPEEARKRILKMVFQALSVKVQNISTYRVMYTIR
jgi:hypothetical protein